MVIAQMFPSASTSSTVFSSRSRVSATVAALNSMCNVSVSAKYVIFTWHTPFYTVSAALTASTRTFISDAGTSIASVSSRTNWT